MIRQVTLVGMGALGILFGHTFSKSLGGENVRFVADGERLERYRREGAYCNGEKCDFHFSDGTDGQAELLIFTVKATGLEQAMEVAAPCIGPNTILLAALNGVTSEEILSRKFGPEKVLYMVTQGADAVRVDNQLTSQMPGMAYIGIPQEDYFDRQEKLDAVAEFFQRTGFPFAVEEDILHRMWCKYMMNVGVNQVCMAFECDYGGVQQPGKLRDTMIAAMHETRKVGACQGVLVTQGDLQEYLDLLDSLPPKAMPSMRQDGLAHRPTEVDLFAGAMVEMAGQFGMRVPVNEMLLERIREMEQSWGN